MDKLQRRTVRYWCFRFRNEVLNGVPSDGAPEGLKEHFEKLEGFRGWDRFAVSWDVPHKEYCNGNGCICGRDIVPLEIVLRKYSVWEEWQATIRSEAPTFPGLEKHEKRLED